MNQNNSLLSDVGAALRATAIIVAGKIRVIMIVSVGRVDNGALGVVAKTDMFAEVGKAVRAVHSGRATFTNEIVSLGLRP